MLFLVSGAGSVGVGSGGGVWGGLGSGVVAIILVTARMGEEGGVTSGVTTFSLLCKKRKEKGITPLTQNR